jgi:hypothetical protein
MVDLPTLSLIQNSTFQMVAILTRLAMIVVWWSIPTPRLKEARETLWIVA